MEAPVQRVGKRGVLNRVYIREGSYCRELGHTEASVLKLTIRGKK